MSKYQFSSELIGLIDGAYEGKNSNKTSKSRSLLKPNMASVIMAKGGLSR